MPDWFDGGGSSSPVDVAKCLDGQQLDGVVEMVQVGALVSLGTTSDGGALAVTVTVDGRWRREYFRDGESLLDWVAEALPAVRAAVEALPASSERRTRKRGARGL